MIYTCTGEEVVLIVGYTVCGALYAVCGTWYAVSDIYRRESCLSSWLRGMWYTVSDIIANEPAERRREAGEAAAL